MTRFVPYSDPGAYGIMTELWRADRYGNRIEQIAPSILGAGSITFNEDVAVKRSFSIAVDDPFAFDAFHDWLIPVVAISDPEGNAVREPQGLYLVTPPSTSTEASGSIGQVEGRDGCQLLVLATRDDMVWQSGVDGGAFIRQLAFEAGWGLAQVLVPDFGVAPTDDRPFDPGTTVFAAMSEVAVACGHYAPWCNAAGRLVSAPYQPLTDKAPVWTYTNATDQDASWIEGSITEQPDWTRLANTVTIRRLGMGDEPSLAETVRNENPQSRVSIPSLGFAMANPPYDDIIEFPESAVTDEERRAWMRAKGQALLSERASHLRKLTLPTFPDLFADAHQVVGLEIRHGSWVTYEGRWWRSGWTLTLDGGKTAMVQHLKRVEVWQ